MMPAAARLPLIVWLSIPLLAQGQSRAPALVFHGNYRGLGNNVPLPPIDALDAACARHDACTPAGGLPSCPAICACTERPIVSRATRGSRTMCGPWRA
jgi:hypothetical protein